VSLEQALEQGRREDVAVTFDDGHATHYAEAFPILTRLGCTATFFVTTSLVGKPNHASWAQLREMAAAGMSIQSHTDTHAFLSQLDAGGVARELETSKSKLDDVMGRATISLALPGGDFPRRAHRGLIARAGYRILATSRWGANRTPAPDWEGLRLVRRYTVRRETTASRFERLGRGSSTAVSFEGLRLTSLAGIRSLLGAGRYARWRRAALGLLGR
jgi:peptidoglycan/xylan/chitin deacetylase (PgdA/CDA1 family)